MQCGNRMCAYACEIIQTCIFTAVRAPYHTIQYSYILATMSTLPCRSVDWWWQVTLVTSDYKHVNTQ